MKTNMCVCVCVVCVYVCGVCMCGVCVCMCVCVCVCVIISHWILLKMRNVSGKFVEKITIQILISIIFFPESRAFYEIMWKKMVAPDMLQMTI